MKILQVMAGGERGGAETAFVDMCIALHESGQDVQVVTRANDIRVPRLAKAGIQVHTAPFGGVLDAYTPWKIISVIRKFKPAIVQTWMSRASDKTPAWSSLSSFMGVPPYKVVARLGGYYKMKYFRSADYFMAITPDLRSYLEGQGVAPARITEINNFAETEEVSGSVDRAEYGVPDGAPLLLALGRLHEAKAFDMLIKAVEPLDGVYVWIAGEGPERLALEDLIRKTGTQDRVTLLGWRSDRAALFQAADICVFPSRYEPFGTVFVQSWAQETPLITTASDGPRQFVRHGEDGIVVPIDDIDALRGGIRTLIDSPDLCRTLVRNGRARYENGFTKEKTVGKYMEFYSRIIASEAD